MVLALTVAVAVAAACVWALVVPRLRIDDEDAPDLAALVTPRSTAVVAVTALAAALILLVVPAGHRWVWVGYLAVGVPLVGVDLRTTFLPARLNWAAAAAMAVGLLVVGVRSPMTAVSSLLGALAVAAFLYVVWRFSSGLGFGDVRLGLLIGAVAGLSGASAVGVALFAGTLLGALHGVGHLLWAGRDPARPREFPYGPALYAGAFVAALLPSRPSRPWSPRPSPRGCGRHGRSRSHPARCAAAHASAR
ncbi:prepilin peptidase [Tessaracoccus sp. HDW20]|uniref:prepilin peptidase n=1 Tax=Tessaracoccus coleopterorum TaxID=2714950 RepID=UPI0018D35CB1|nr:A24 family peptidase [Tessaracoccus coleopterorum]NHB84008.1 prepilin peptidase [Tessaracoccus coleopterorum]